MIALARLWTVWLLLKLSGWLTTLAGKLMRQLLSGLSCRERTP